jgi:hypothetical protein
MLSGGNGMSERITSVEVAAVMLKCGRYMTISEIMAALTEAYPELENGHTSVTNIVRTFMKSPSASCFSFPGAYPRMYLLTSVSGYLFKIRGNRQVCYDDLPFHSGSKKDLELENKKSQEVSRLAFNLFNSICRERIASGITIV